MKNIEEITINWSEAEQISKQVKIEREQEKIEYEKNLEKAVQHFWECLESDNFHDDDLQDAAILFGVEEEDILFRII